MKAKIIAVCCVATIAMALLWLQYDNRHIIITNERGINKSILIFQLKTHGLYKNLDRLFDVGTWIIPATDTTYYYQIKDTMWYPITDSIAIREGGEG